MESLRYSINKRNVYMSLVFLTKILYFKYKNLKHQNEPRFISFGIDELPEGRFPLIIYKKFLSNGMNLD